MSDLQNSYQNLKNLKKTLYFAHNYLFIMGFFEITINYWGLFNTNYNLLDFNFKSTIIAF